MKYNIFVPVNDYLGERMLEFHRGTAVIQEIGHGGWFILFICVIIGFFTYLTVETTEALTRRLGQVFPLSRLISVIRKTTFLPISM